MMLWHAAAAALVAGAVGGWQARAWKAGADDLERIKTGQRDTLRRQEAAFGSADRLEQDRAARREVVRTITVEVPRVIERPVYRAECWDADGLRILTAAIGANADPAEPDGPVPASAPAR